MNKVYSSYFLGLFLVTFMVSTTNSQAQNFTERPEFIKANSNWIYQKSGGGIYYQLDLNTNPAAVIEMTDMYDVGSYQNYIDEALASVSDTADGSLLFFTNGLRVYNAEYQLMPDGIIFSNTPSYTEAYPMSVNQGTLIVPVIGDPNKYYIFCQAYGEFGNGLYYSVVDMTLDGGLGDIVPGQKAIIIDPGPLQEGMIAMPGDNCDVWLMMHPIHDTIFKTYHITDAGIDLNPVVSSPGSAIPANDIAIFEYGNIGISPLRDKVAIGSYGDMINICSVLGLVPDLGGVMLADFNPETGEVSNGIKIEDSIAAYSCYFSPDGSKLYVQGIPADYENPMEGVGPMGNGSVFQYDLSSGNAVDINMSRYLVHDFFPYAQFYQIRHWGDTLIFADLTYVANPNLPGAACNFQETSYFGAINVADFEAPYTLGHNVVYPLPPDTLYRMAMDTIVCVGLVLNAPPAYVEYLWDNSETGTTREVTHSGNYWVAYNDGCHYKVDTFQVTIPELDPIITVNVFDLGTTLPYDSYQWVLNGELLDGATSSTYTVLENGDYQVIVGSVDGCTDTSAIYLVANVGIENAHYMAAYVHIYPNPASDVIHIEATIDVAIVISTVEGRVLLSTDQYKEPISVSTLAAGMYLIKIYDRDGRVIKTEKLIKQL